MAPCRGLVAAFVFAASACAGASSGPRVPDPQPYFALVALPSEAGPLLEAVRGRFGEGAESAGPVRAHASYRWRPRAGEELWLLMACQGDGAARACAIAVARWVHTDAGAGFDVAAVEPVGWSRAQLGETADRGELVIAGEDGRGNWRQAVHYVSDRRLAQFGRRVYVEGP